MKKLLSLADGLALATTLTACSSEPTEDSGGEGFGGSISRGIPGDSSTPSDEPGPLPPDAPAGGIAAVRTFDIPTYTLNGDEEVSDRSTVRGTLHRDRECFVLDTGEELVGLVFPNAQGVEDDAGTYFVEWADAGNPLREDSQVSLTGHSLDGMNDSWHETGWASLCPDSEVQGLFKVLSMGE